MNRLVGLVAVVFAALGLAACSEEAPTGFGADNRNGFLAACSEPLDTRLISDICQCVFDETTSAIVFTDFAALDTELEENPDQPLPAGVTNIIADCVLEEADL